MNNQQATRIFVDCHVFDDGFQGTRTYLEGIYKILIKDKNFHFFLASTKPGILQTVFGKPDNVTYLQYK